MMSNVAKPQRNAIRSDLLLLAATIVLGGCATGGQMPVECGPVPIDSSFTLVTGDAREMLIDELASANTAGSVDNFSLKTSKQYLAYSGDRAFVCELSSCSPAWWSFERVEGKWVNRSHSPAVCVVR